LIAVIPEAAQRLSGIHNREWRKMGAIIGYGFQTSYRMRRMIDVPISRIIRLSGCFCA
jgi:hypothetical protein